MAIAGYSHCPLRVDMPQAASTWSEARPVGHRDGFGDKVWVRARVKGQCAVNGFQLDLVGSTWVAQAMDAAKGMVDEARGGARTAGGRREA